MLANRWWRQYVKRMRLSLWGFMALAACTAVGTAAAAAESTDPPAAAAPSAAQKLLYERKILFDEVSSVTGIPWYYLAAIDQYERTLSVANPKKRPQRKGLIGIYFSEPKWVGMMNPDYEDTDPASIVFFNGYGRDGSGDGLADRNNDLDVLSAMASYMLKYGTQFDDFRIGLWEYYQNTRSVERIEQFADLYAAFGTLSLHEHSFPLPLGSHYSYRGTWGASRGWGGFRIHEGTDIFAGHGVPVRSVSYGMVEVKGWNPYGGWRIGIRDIDNIYHYYAHLSGFHKEIKEGDLVSPGQVIGWVGSSGYGKPGTQGKFPPHLHYGTYRDNGLAEWSFDPYPLLRRWEREERARKQGR